MKNILIPTNFNPASFKLVGQALTTVNEKVNIVFFHAFQQPFFYTDFIRDDDSPKLLVTDSLRQQCRQLKEKFPELIGTITFELMRGNSNALFRNIIEANKIDLIICPKHYTYVKMHKDSINPLPFFEHCKTVVLQNLTERSKGLMSDKMFAEIGLAS